MAKGSNNRSSTSSSSNRRTSHATKPYDVNNSLVRKVATKVTDLIPQRSWIGKWFHNSQDNVESTKNLETPEQCRMEHQQEEQDEEEEEEEEANQQKPPPSKRPCIRMDVTHPPGTFAIHPRKKLLPKEQYLDDERDRNNETCSTNLDSTSRIHALVSSTPAIISNCRSELNSLLSTRNEVATNGTDDNSESSESTSGCSSLIPQTNRQEGPTGISYRNSPFSNGKRLIDDKLSFANNSPRSLFLDGHLRDSLSSRRPSFDASIVNNTFQERANTFASPFYSGNTTFGGANTAGLYRSRSLFDSSNQLQLKIPARKNIRVKPSNIIKGSSASSDNTSGMSQTAKRILEALEDFSSPISDAKKIPLRNANNTNSPPFSSRKRSRDDAIAESPRVGLRHLTRELVVPTVPDLLKLRRRQKLRDTTLAARQIVSARNAASNPHPSEYSLGSESDKKDTTNKIRGKVRKDSKKPNLEEEETVPAVNLPNVQLKLTSLPEFNIEVPKATNTENHLKTGQFTFASPIKVSTSSESVLSINNFSFSSPISLKDSCWKSEKNQPNFIFNENAPLKLKEKSTETSTDKIKEFKSSGSVMDILGKTQESSTDNTKGVWECSECLTKNTKGSEEFEKCIVCKTPKPSNLPNGDIHASADSQITKKPTETNEKKASSFGSTFKFQIDTNKVPEPSKPETTVKSSKEKADDTWDCPGCFLKNSKNVTNCICCNASKTLEKKVEKFDAALKPAKESWECPSCMVRNAATCLTCPCCSTKKPGDETKSTEPQKDATQSEKATPLPTESQGFGDMFKKAEGSWECDACMVRNKPEATECVSCTTPKPGCEKKSDSKEETSKAPTFSFGIPSSATTSTSTSTAASSGFTFGVPADAKTSSTFTFGIPKDAKEESKDSTKGFTFGVPPVATATATATTTATAAATQQPSGFVFGANKTPATGESSETGPTTSNLFGTTSTNWAGSRSPSSFGSTAQKTAGTAEAKTATFGTTETKSTSVENKQSSFATPETKSTESVEPKPAVFTSTATNEAPKVPPNFGIAETKSATFPAPETSSTGIFGTPNKLPNNFSTPDGKTSLFATPTENKPASTPTFGTTESKVATASAPSTENIIASVFGTRNNKIGTIGSPGSAMVNFSTPENKAANTATPDNKISSFGNFESKQTETKPTFLAPEAPKAQTFENKLPGFSSSETTSVSFVNTENKLPSFGSVETKQTAFGTTEAKPTPSFLPTDSKVPTFGTLDNKVPTFASSENKLPTFGATAPAENKLTGFGGTETPKLPTFGTTDTKLGSFGDAKPRFDDKVNYFGAPNKPITFGAPENKVSSSTFGTSTAPTFTNNTFGTFGSNSNTSATGFQTNPPPAFPKSDTNSSNQTQGVFTFGGTSQSTTTPARGFNFSDPNAQAQKPAANPTPALFTFGSTANTTHGNGFGGVSSTFNPTIPAATTTATTGGFNFNQPKVETSTNAPVIPTFGQSSVTPSLFGTPNNVLGQNTGTATPFGGQESNSTAGFTFGSTANVAPTVGNPSFALQSAAPPAAPATNTSGGFNFSAASPTVSFDPNTRPSFNFTGGSAPTTFSAPPQPVRKIKKAVRRRNP